MEKMNNKYEDEESSSFSNENEEENIIPPQYKDLPSDVVEELWQNPIFMDSEKNKKEAEKRKNAIERLKAEENKKEELKKIEDIRAKIDSIGGKLSEKDIMDIKNEAYAKYKNDPDINVDIMLANIEWEIGQRFDAHGIAKGGITTQFDDLIRILKEGIDSDRSFYTAPLEVDPEKKAALGAGLGTGGGAAYKDGSFILLSEPDSSILKGGVKYVIINAVYYHAIDKLAQAFPNTEFIKAIDINKRLKEILKEKEVEK